jgi:hypothetical protein
LLLWFHARLLKIFCGVPGKQNMHDFKDQEKGKIVPHGIYDPTANAGWVSIGITHDTAEFAVTSIRTWILISLVHSDFPVTAKTSTSGVAVPSLGSWPGASASSAASCSDRRCFRTSVLNRRQGASPNSRADSGTGATSIIGGGG